MKALKDVVVGEEEELLLVVDIALVEGGGTPSSTPAMCSSAKMVWRRFTWLGWLQCITACNPWLGIGRE